MDLSPGTVSSAGTRPDGLRWSRAGLGASQLLFLVVLAPLVYYETFSVFRDWDDEGYMMLSVKHLLDGHVLCDEVNTLYGPVYFVYKWLIHGFAGLPLTHDVVRLTACGARLAIGVAASCAAFGLTRSVPLAATAQVLVTAYLTDIRNEPGHPQELAGLLTMVVVAIPTIVRRRERVVTVILGVAIGLLAMIKINLGLLAGVATWMAILGSARATRPVVALRVVSGAIVAAMPWLLMRLRLEEPMTFAFASAETAALLALGVLSLTRSDDRGRGSDLWWYAAACAATVALTVLGTILTGTTLRALLESLVLTPARMPGLFFVPFFGWRPGIAAIAAVLALAARLAGRRLPEGLVVCAKLAFGIFACAMVWQRSAFPLVGIAAPFSWLVVVPVDGSRSIHDVFARLVLCWTAVLSPLQGYPVAGSQIVFGTVLLALCAVVCLGDGVRWLASYAGPLAVPWVRAAAGGALLLGLMLASGREDLLAAHAYRQLVPLELPGAERIRLPDREVEVYRALAGFIRERADTLFSDPGFSSLYFWTGTAPPTLDVIGNAMGFYSAERQTAMVNALLSASRPLVVRFRSAAQSRADVYGSMLPPEIVSKRIDRTFVPVARFGNYEVLARRVR